VVSIYVNPSQFAENEDFDKYPRTLDDDVKKLEKTGQCHAVYAPSSMYDDQHSTMVVPAGAADGLESLTRPHFFTGVATIVLKLFQHVPAHIALFGEKDFQQLSVVRQMTQNLDLQIEIIGAATVRDTHGLALSSRNQYLSADQLSIAPQLYQQLCIIAQRITQGDAQERVIADAQHALLNAGFDEVDYLEICDAVTLKPAQNNRQGPIRILAAVRLGTTRLIDNIALDQSDTLA
jgi:pantoate--beta-alanine ligase